MKKIKRKPLIKKLDEVVSKIVRRRGSCIKCGSRINMLNCSHWYGRVVQSVRWDFDNVKCACVGCHFWFDGHPHEHTEFVKELLGDLNFDALRLKANTGRKLETYELQELLTKLKEKLETCGVT
ncbi:MAG TPA: hypothetical protein ENH82_17225 [bacterium]|nr:hypothetical protein [bacterium]